MRKTPIRHQLLWSLLVPLVSIFLYIKFGYRYKKAKNLPIYVPAREQEKLTDIANKAGPEMASYAQELYQLLFTLSKDYQHSCNLDSE